ncbi:MAG TPA: DUF5674 family protein, partial [Chloroflexota bacterium]|nr:DUF5674 family protein [Chloroflexota bacterium]
MREVDLISVQEIRVLAEPFGGELVKAVVDIDRGRFVVDMELHVDGEQFLLASDSTQAALWGINLYPDEYGGDAFVEFDSAINI